MSEMKIHILRLTPGQEVKSSLEEYVARNAPNGVVIMTCCGSVTSATLRFAANPDGTTDKIKTYNQHLEVLGMSGTVSVDGAHLHICLSDDKGATLGGSRSWETSKSSPPWNWALGQPTDLRLQRQHDPATGYDELAISESPSVKASSSDNKT